jgi:hypothetical protein
MTRDITPKKLPMDMASMDDRETEMQLRTLDEVYEKLKAEGRLPPPYPGRKRSAPTE